MAEEKISDLATLLDDLYPTIRALKKLQESGIIAIVDAFADNFDELFNYASKMSILDGISAIIKLAPIANELLKFLDLYQVQENLKNIPWDKVAFALASLTEFMAKDFENVIIPQNKTGMLKTLEEIEKPEMQYLLNIAMKFSKRMMDNMSKIKKP